MKILSKNTSDTETKDTCNNDKYHTPEQALKILFGYDSFRAGQKSVIDSILAGRDAFAVMPTGAGKSVCYQIPAVLLPGITLVVSPLISLMQDQVKALNEAGVPAAFINSSLSEKDYNETIRRARQGIYKIIYIAPERLATESFLTLAKSVPISMVTVDEAHCISQWGQDFRPSYMKIVEFVKTLEKRPIISAFTATATETVREDIVCTLGLQNPFTLVNGFDRENLFFQVEKPKNKEQYILKYISEHSGDSGIIYCATRKNVDNIYELLKSKGISVGKYHAGMNAEERKKMQDDFVFDYTSIVVATNAFGMGIDKSNVRFVIHYNMPQSMENYYQEAGRAGRDGSPAECILLYSPQDVRTNRYLIENSDPNPDLDFETQEKLIQREYDRLRKMTYYCTTADCLRAFILKYFGEPAEEYCGNCSSCAGGSILVAATVEAQQVLSCVARTGQRLGISMICDILRGSENERVLQMNLQTQSTYGLMREKPIFEIKRIIDALLMQELLIQTDGQYPVLKLTQNARPVLLGEKSFEMRIPVPQEKAKKPDKAAGDADPELFARLKKLRAALAAKASVPAYVVFTDTTLRDMCAKMPTDEQELLQVSGVGERKAHRYGKAFLEEINRKAEEE